MGVILESYHTHAEGRKHGWWGTMWHSAHFTDGGKEISGTAWKFEVKRANSLSEAQYDLRKQRAEDVDEDIDDSGLCLESLGHEDPSYYTRTWL